MNAGVQDYDEMPEAFADWVSNDGRHLMMRFARAVLLAITATALAYGQRHVPYPGAALGALVFVFGCLRLTYRAAICIVLWLSALVLVTPEMISASQNLVVALQRP